MLAGSAPLELRLYKRLRGEGPSKRPRTGLHRRPCVSAHVCRARARAQQCTTSSTAVQLYCRALADSARGFSMMSHLRCRGASLRLAAHHVHGHPATRQPTPARACPIPSACRLAHAKFACHRTIHVKAYMYTKTLGPARSSRRLTFPSTNIYSVREDSIPSRGFKSHPVRNVSPRDIKNK